MTEVPYPLTPEPGQMHASQTPHAKRSRLELIRLVTTCIVFFSMGAFVASTLAYTASLHTVPEIAVDLIGGTIALVFLAILSKN